MRQEAFEKQHAEAWKTFEEWVAVLSSQHGRSTDAGLLGDESFRVCGRGS